MDGLLTTHHRNARVRPHPQKARAVGTAAHAVVACTIGAADHHGEFRHRCGRNRRHELCAVAGNAAGFVFLADHEAGDVLQEQQRDVSLAAQFDEMRSLQRAFAEQYAVVGDDPDRVSPDVRKAADQRLTIEFLEFLELGAINDARDDLADIERLAGIGRHDTVDFLAIEQRLARLSVSPAADDCAGLRLPTMRRAMPMAWLSFCA